MDFKRVFKKSDDDLESHIAEGGSSNFEQVLPKMIPELADGSNKVTLKHDHAHTNTHIPFLICFISLFRGPNTSKMEYPRDFLFNHISFYL